jgi:hypothetical protein
MRALLRLLELVLRLLEQAIETRRRKKRQAQRDELESDPAGFFDNHFNGVRKPKSDATDKTGS